MVDLESGSLLIDEIDIDSVGVHTLREKLLVIPQHAPILGVSIRENIDPKHEHSDQQIWNCLGTTKFFSFARSSRP
jgi:ABC-type multidrug transport system fused ATPase/permease subunit